ncbi:MAG: hypothetical protein V1901_00410 [Patescibacteria group bacterium]|nr:hypothetical protein [Patescibacteria group bacterium]
MKKYILPVRQADRNIYDFIKNGQKKVETRIAGPKYENIKDGDIIIFKCGQDKFERIVKNVCKFKSVDKMLKVYNPQDINPNIDNIKDLKLMYDSFSGYKEKIKKYGIIAFKLSK